MHIKAMLRLGGVCALSLVVMLGLGTIGHLRQLSDPTDIILQDGILLVLMLGLNAEWLRVPIFLRSALPLRRQVTINLVPLSIMGLTGLELLNFARVQLQPFVMPVTLAFLLALCVASYEEYFFRGLVLALVMRLMPHHLLSAVTGASLIFGLFHLVNWVHQPLNVTLLQVGNAWAMGMLLAAVYLRTRGLLWPVVWHFANDFTVMVMSGLAEDTRPTASVSLGVLVAVIYVGTALFLLRPAHREGLEWPTQPAEHVW
ncbi:CPBP family intramembrane glutamic endopeptidase [Levilactobacillus zymae]|uniref:CPBP family intramembrane glutamic endopeptidase n=1 Tax=Levilactobacillus zymae TaxID=267363 RepID=UPI0028B7FC1E|nr:CPBP family intramembrane glutamic endopeptidase [Levilactobacillus zymae]MDT6981504.1 CPBP family intramembrane glutamic endopeptidase [Levilactobacillus zymae]